MTTATTQGAPSPHSVAATADPSPRGAAQIAGVGYVVLFVLGIFANFVVREGLIESGDAQATAANIIESEGLFRIGLISFMVSVTTTTTKHSSSLSWPFLRSSPKGGSGSGSCCEPTKPTQPLRSRRDRTRQQQRVSLICGTSRGPQAGSILLH